EPGPNTVATCRTLRTSSSRSATRRIMPAWLRPLPRGTAHSRAGARSSDGRLEERRSALFPLDDRHPRARNAAPRRTAEPAKSLTVAGAAMRFCDVRHKRGRAKKFELLTCENSHQH